MTKSDSKILMIGDNVPLLESLSKVITAKGLDTLHRFTYACSPGSDAHSSVLGKLTEIDVQRFAEKLARDYHIVISVHCKQIFPAGLLRSATCINIHPGFNPYNRGWYPHVFSIINGMPTGVTIHIIDEKIDHGPIITQQKVPIYSYDTSDSVYARILEAEIRLFSDAIDKIVDGTYEAFSPSSDGNINSKSDFERLRRIDLSKTYTGQEFINLLRALSHGGYDNAYFVDSQGSKVYIKLSLERDK